MAMYTIGQFSRITGLSIKTIRLYHEKGLLTPALVDQWTNYRYFDDHNAETARAIAYLRELEFPLADIQSLLCEFREDTEILPFLEKQKSVIQTRIKELHRAAVSLDDIIRREREVMTMLRQIEAEVQEKNIDEQTVMSLRWKGKYSQTGKRIGQVARQAGRFIRGAPFNLYYDGDYKEDGADIESCFPVGQLTGERAKAARVLPGGRCASLIHKGPYEQIGLSYKRIYGYVQRKGYRVIPPVREIYLKGPGMIFRGNPKNYLTEIQIMISPDKENGYGSDNAKED
jgi:DNA-binding transcriptional MerR regulator